MTTKQRLELTWIGKYEQPNLEPRILIEDPSKSYGDKRSENMLIHGDNLLALKALEQDFANKIKCVYIDPPFNVGAAFEHYDDSVEHSIWLSLMRDRFMLIKKLLRDDGVMFLHLDDSEMAYAKVLCDEIFGRSNYLNAISMTTNDPSGFKATSSKLFSTVNYLLVYAKSKPNVDLKKIYIENDYDTAYNKVLLNKDAPHSQWKWKSIKDVVSLELGYKSSSEAQKELGEEFGVSIEEFALKNSSKVFRTAAVGGGARIKRKATIELSRKERDKVFVHPNEDVKGFYIVNGEQIIFYENRISLIDGMRLPAKLLTDVWTDISWTGIASEGGVEFKNGKKPEKLIQRCFELVSEEGDWVLDSFLGSGTTTAVAHKMNRRWVGIEFGAQCDTHCVFRLKSVVDGTDQSGISVVEGWKGGGGFKYYDLALSLLRKDDFGNWVIEEQYKPDMLASAMAKHEGFKYCPDQQVYWKHGQSTERDFIYTTTNFLTVEMLDKIHNDMKHSESLLICCKSFSKICDGKYANITVKKIPNILLGKCEFGKKDYSLNIVSMPVDDNEADLCSAKKGK